MMRFFDDDEPYIIIIPHRPYRRRTRLFRLFMFRAQAEYSGCFSYFLLLQYSFPDYKSHPYGTIDAVLEN